MLVTKWPKPSPTAATKIYVLVELLFWMEKYGVSKWIFLSEIYDFVNNLCSMFMFRSNMKIPDFENMKIIKFQIIIFDLLQSKMFVMVN